MHLSSGVPLAWLNLTHSKVRFLVSVLGISFAVVLMFVQLGFWRALLDSQTTLLNSIDADLVLVSASLTTITDPQSFPLDRVRAASAVAGVESSKPLYIRFNPFLWKNREGPVEIPEWPIRVIAVEPDRRSPLFREDRMPGFAEMQERLSAPRSALMDERSKPAYDAIRRWHAGGPSPVGVEREVGGKSLQIVGLFRLGTDFTSDGTLLMSNRTLAELLPERDPLEAVQIGLVKFAPGADRTAVLNAIRHSLPPDVRVLTRSDLAANEEAFWTHSTPIGFIFMLGLAVGFIVGVVICYQILSTEVADHMAEFATLKAIGYHDRFISAIVIREALWLSLLGFAAGLALGWPLYLILENQTGLPLLVTFPRAVLILVLTVTMCVLSGFIALRRVRTADPAEVFG